jgi:flagellar motility protein MotE (MotC chaperone)
MKKASAPPDSAGNGENGENGKNGKNGKNGANDAAEAQQQPRRDKKLSTTIVFGLVFVLLVATAAGLIAFNTTARARASGLVTAILRLAGRGGHEPVNPDNPPPTEKEVLAAERAALAAERAMLETLKSDLAGLQTALAGREEVLALGEQALQEQMARQAALTADLNRLVRICQQMRPREAAELLEQLETSQALAILLRLGETSAAQILGAMSRDRAAQLIKLMVPVTTG